MLAALAVMTLVVGNVVAIVQTNSSACSPTRPSPRFSASFVLGLWPHADGYAAALYYTLVYVLVALGSSV